jgi:hypothetical protein
MRIYTIVKACELSSFSISHTDANAKILHAAEANRLYLRDLNLTFEVNRCEAAKAIYRHLLTDPQCSDKNLKEMAVFDAIELLAANNEAKRKNASPNDDTKDDITTHKATSGKKRKKRAMNAPAVDCARRYRNKDNEAPLKTVVEDYVEEHGGSVSSILRTLNDNPDQWKNDT